MKKHVATVICMFLLALPVVAPAAQGGFQGPGATQGVGGFQGPMSGTAVDTVAKAKSSWDDTAVVLTGTIVSQVAGKDDKFMFRDGTGEILVDIDRKVFAGRTVTPANTVRIAGEVDKDMLEPVKIDVKILEILK